MPRSLTPFLLILGMISTAGAAVPASPPAATFTGFFLGMDTGFIHICADTRWVNHIPGPSLDKGGRYATTARGCHIGIHGIAGYVFASRLYLGGEVTGAVNFANGATRDYTNYGLVYRYALKDSYTASVRAGLSCCKTLLYIKAGLALTGRKVSSQYFESQPLKDVRSSKKYIWGPVAGIGFYLALTPRVTCGLESVYTRYLSDRFTPSGAATNRMQTEAFNFKLKIAVKL